MIQIFHSQSGGQKSENQVSGRAAFLLVALEDDPFACLFQLPEVAGSSGLAAPPWSPSDLGLSPLVLSLHRLL